MKGLVPADWIPSSAWEEVRILAARRAFADLVAVATLAYRGLGHQALVVARSAMELAITVEYLSQDTTSRAPAYVDWMQVFFARVSDTGMLDTELSHLAPGAKEKVKERAVQLAAKHKRSPDAHRWTSATIQEMAAAVNLKDWYDRDYAIFSEVAHGARFGLTDPPDEFSLAALDQTNQAFGVILTHAAAALGMDVDSRVLRIRERAYRGAPRAHPGTVR